MKKICFLSTVAALVFTSYSAFSSMLINTHDRNQFGDLDKTITVRAKSALRSLPKLYTKIVPVELKIKLLKQEDGTDFAVLTNYIGTKVLGIGQVKMSENEELDLSKLDFLEFLAAEIKEYTNETQMIKNYIPEVNPEGNILSVKRYDYVNHLKLTDFSVDMKDANGKVVSKLEISFDEK